MYVLFVSSGNKKEGISSIVKNQAESLKGKHIELDHFTINEKGLKGYIKSIPKLRSQLRQNNYAIIHAHYSLSAIVATFAGAKLLVVSLMGSDIKSKDHYKLIIKFFIKFFWSKTILKSEDLRKSLKIKDAEVIPNGVDLKRFKPISEKAALLETGWDTNNKHILFAAHPSRPEKNFKLVQNAFDLLDRKKIELHYLDNIPNYKMPYYYNSADVVLLTSLWEGSPNVIKEAMACNCPIVSTDIGDIRWVFGKTLGCYIAKNDFTDVAEKIKKAILYNNRTTGRERIIQLGLDSKVIANKIIKVYKKVISISKLN